MTEIILWLFALIPFTALAEHTSGSEREPSEPQQNSGHHQRGAQAAGWRGKSG